jgi:hypothetical protein
MKAFRIFLLVLIIIGLALIFTENIWVPRLVAMIVANDAASASALKEGGIRGTVALSPTCPVERMPPDPQCAPKPYQTDIEISSATGRLIRTIQNTSDGSFLIALPIGDYVISAAGGNPYPRCSSAAVTVSDGETASITLSCDTGIR